MAIYDPGVPGAAGPLPGASLAPHGAALLGRGVAMRSFLSPFCSFPAKKYKKVTGKEIYSDTLESTPMLEKEKFPQDYFPEVRPPGPAAAPSRLLLSARTLGGDLGPEVFMFRGRVPACLLPRLGVPPFSEGLTPSWVHPAGPRWGPRGRPWLTLHGPPRFLTAVSRQSTRPTRRGKTIIRSGGARRGPGPPRRRPAAMGALAPGQRALWPSLRSSLWGAVIERRLGGPERGSPPPHTLSRGASTTERGSPTAPG